VPPWKGRDNSLHSRFLFRRVIPSAPARLKIGSFQNFLLLKLKEGIEKNPFLY